MTTDNPELYRAVGFGRWSWRSCWLLVLAVLIATPAAAGPALREFNAMQQAGLLVESPEGGTLRSRNAERRFVPASTVKLITAWLALRRWGADHRFETLFCRQADTGLLWVRGGGDPYLVSDELRAVAGALRERGYGELNGIGLDGSLFADGLVLPGTGSSNNPYDAVPSAIAANFNTINLRKRGTRVLSAEPETPLTPYARSMASGMSRGVLRVNTGPSPRDAERYFAELLREVLRETGLNTGTRISHGSMPADVTNCYRHRNSRTLAEVVRPMLRFSTNFIANQLVLMLAAEHHPQAVDAARVEKYLTQALRNAFGWEDFRLRDGAGLSRDNRLSSRQLIDVVRALEPWRGLLPKVEPGVLAKSGTLTGISTLAGYLESDDQWRPFALMMNEPGSWRLRNRIALELLESRSR